MSTTFYNINTEAELRDAIFQVSDDFAKDSAVTVDYVLNIVANITLTQSLPMIRGDGIHAITINGFGHAIDANAAGRVFFVESGKVNIDSVTVDSALAQGGTGGSADGGGGGGGLGAGGAVFVNTGASLTLSHVDIGDAKAIGGTGGVATSVDDLGGGGGGGLGGSGGNAARFGGWWRRL